MRKFDNSVGMNTADITIKIHEQANDKLETSARCSFLLKLIIISILLGIYACIAEASQAQNFYISDYKEKIHAVISADKKNQISFEGMTITNVIGEEEKYQIVPDELNQNLFLISHAPEGEVIELSFTSCAGKVINIALQVKNAPGQMIFIKDAGEEYLLKKAKEEEIANLLRAMIKDKNIKGKYFISKKMRKLNLPLNQSNSKITFEDDSYQEDNTHRVEINNISNKKNYEIVQDRTYSYKDFLGARIIVTNKDKKIPLEIVNADFANLFNQTLSVTIDQNLLLPKSKAYVFIVAEKRE